MEWIKVAYLFLLISIFLLTRAIFCLPFLRISHTTKSHRSYEDHPIHFFIFLGSGGHTGEMIRLILNYHTSILRDGNSLHIGYSDKASLNKFRRNVLSKDVNIHIKYYKLLKARDVHSGKIQSVISIIKTLFSSSIITFKVRLCMLGKPHAILFNGPGTCYVLALWFKLFDIITFSQSNIIYIESLARISSLSLTGKLIYPLTDEFIVQWPELLTYRNAKYYGILV